MYQNNPVTVSKLATTLVSGSVPGCMDLTMENVQNNPIQKHNEAITICFLNLLLVAWVVVRFAPAADASILPAIGDPHVGHVGA
jgi:hypothetical protein